MEEKKLPEKEKCYGCGACAAVCAHHAIKMEMDQQGFFYPEIDTGKCTNCKQCSQVCPSSRESSYKHEKSQECLAFKNTNAIRLHSASGGAFTALTDFLQGCRRAICFGVQYNEQWLPVHAAAETLEKRDSFCGSKYAQSQMEDIYKQIKKLLRDNQLVLFSGTPCQVVALYRYLDLNRVQTDRLVTIDIVCHGVASPGVWNSYIRCLQKKYCSELTAFTFRNKSVDWRGYHLKAIFENGAVVENEKLLDSFSNLLCDDLLLRPVCFRCPYCSTSRCADITIGDFWGIDEIDANFNDNIGVSMLVPNTERGKEVIANLLENEQYSIIKFPMDVAKQRNLHSPTVKGYEYNKFWDLYATKGFLKAAQRCGAMSRNQKLHRFRIRLERKLKSSLKG